MPLSVRNASKRDAPAAIAILKTSLNTGKSAAGKCVFKPGKILPRVTGSTHLTGPAQTQAKACGYLFLGECALRKLKGLRGCVFKIIGKIRSEATLFAAENLFHAGYVAGTSAGKG